jgi:hypothetical protein
MPHVKSLREVRIVTTNGDSAIVTPRVAKYVPERLLAAALAAGCAQCTEDGKIILDDIPAPKVDADDIPFLSVDERKDPDKRRAVIKLAVLHVYKRNDKADFKGDNTPRNSAIETLVRFPVSNAEIIEILEKLDDQV